MQNEVVKWITSQKLVANAVKSSMRKRISIGLVGHISRHGVAKCGGVAVSAARTCLVANLANTNSKKRRKMRRRKKRRSL